MGNSREATKLRECKDAYRRNLEVKLQQKNTREVWRDMKLITSFKFNIKAKQQDTGPGRSNEVNVFFNRFSTGPPAGPPPKSFLERVKPWVTCASQSPKLDTSAI